MLRNKKVFQAGRRAISAQLRQAVAQHSHRIQVAEQYAERQRHESRQPGIARSARVFPAGFRHRCSRAPARVDVEGGGEGADSRQAENSGNHQVVGEGRRDAQQQSRRAQQDIAEVVVVDEATGKPGINRRESCAAQDAIQIGEVHRLFAALGRMPQVRIGQTNANHEQKGGEGQQLHPSQSPPVLAQEAHCARPRQAGAQNGQASEREQNPALGPDWNLQA